MATRIKRYEEKAERLDELLARIEAEMGPRAELETRRFTRGGFLGLLGGRRMVEIVATLEVDGEDLRQAGQYPSGQVTTAESVEPTSTPTVPGTTAEQQPSMDRVEPDHPASIPGEPQTEMASDLPARGEGRPGIDMTADAPVTLSIGEPNAAGQPPGIGYELLPSERDLVDAEDRPEAPVVPAAPASSSPAGAVQEQMAEEADVVEAVGAEAGDGPGVMEAASETPPLAESSLIAKSELVELRESIAELKETVQQLLERREAGHLPEVDTGPQGSVEPESIPADPVAAASGEGPAQAEAEPAEIHAPLVVDPVSLDPGTALTIVQRQVYDRLLEWNIGPYDAIELINAALSTYDGKLELSTEGLLQLITRDICRNILLSGGIQLSKNPPGKVVALVGATGVGKTTTIAKLAAQFAFQRGKRVSLISLDNYRIAAAEQLRTYSDIMGLDLDIVFSREEFDQVLTQRRHSDLVLIDTAGRSPTNQKQIYELRAVFSAHPPDEVHLVVAASTKGDDLKLIMANFEPLSYDHIIVSKLDETKSLGCIYNINKLCAESEASWLTASGRVPISYFTVGQNVPEDLRAATLSFIQTWIEQGRIT